MGPAGYQHYHQTYEKGSIPGAVDLINPFDAEQEQQVDNYQHS